MTICDGTNFPSWAVRKAVVAASGFTCSYCGSTAECADHIYPLALGGEDDSLNLTAACHHCNSTKGGRLLGAAVSAELRTNAFINVPLVWHMACAYVAGRREGVNRRKNPIQLRGLSNE
ncbi:MAG: HNH endonuclease [Pollutimonas bauzanensis]